VSRDDLIVCLFIHAWGTLLVAQFVETLRYKPERSRVQFQMVSFEFFIDIILPAALWPWGRLSLKQK